MRQCQKCFKALKTCPTQCIQFFSDITATLYRIGLQALGIVRKKQVFCINVLLNLPWIFGFLTLNHWMILQLVIVCSSLDSF